MTGGPNSRSTADGGSGHGDAAEAWTPPERALLDAALGFYGAAEGVIDLSSGKRPQLRHDAAGFRAVRQAMGVLEDRVRDAHASGVPAERIAEIARIERDMVDLILRRDADAAAAPGRADD